jgi:hypothetical protein
MISNKYLGLKELYINIDEDDETEEMKRINLQTSISSFKKFSNSFSQCCNWCRGTCDCATTKFPEYISFSDWANASDRKFMLVCFIDWHTLRAF